MKEHALGATFALATAAVVSVFAGCGNTAAPSDAAPPPSGAPAASAPVATVAKPASLARTATPSERRERDERACGANDAAACRRAADRYRGYGHVAGCGVERSGAKPRRMVTGADADADAMSFDRWIRRACDLGDDEACLQGKSNVVSHTVSEYGADVGVKSKRDGCALHLWQAGMHPDSAKKLDGKRAAFLGGGSTSGLLGDLVRREKTKAGETLPKEVLELAERICKSTLECDDITMMLDKNGYGPAALAPYRKSAAEALVAACLAGDCVCGEAASYLEPGDAKIADLARIGCDDGEPDACYLLGRLGEEADPKNAVALYNLACPTVLAADGRADVYSKKACDRLAELNEEGRLVDKDSDRAFYYSTLACSRSGFERDHAPCLRRALFHGRGYMGDQRWGLRTAMEIAREVFYGSEGAPVDAKECTRPSVQEACKRDEPRLLKSTGN